MNNFFSGDKQDQKSSQVTETNESEENGLKPSAVAKMNTDTELWLQ